jgi:F0F1-type ATP synthase assembly protein I
MVEDKEKTGDEKSGFKIWYAMAFAFQLGFLIIAPIAGLILLGLWADKVFHTFPLLLAVGITTGLIVTAYDIYHFLTPLIDRSGKLKNDDSLKGGDKRNKSR